MLKCLVVVTLALTVTASEALKHHKIKILRETEQSVAKRQAAQSCGSNKFTCTSGECIEETWMCDSEPDCADGSDEKACECQCRGEHKFQCHTGGKCISSNYVCDDDDDCGDNSDELNCHLKTCGSEQVQCDNNRCIHESWMCDGDDDCGNGWDEQNCTGTCEEDQFQCRNNSRCIPVGYLCDGDDDCNDGSDEENCACNTTTHFRCNNDQCIPLEWRCDQGEDCEDISDELGCPTLHPSVCIDVMTLRGCVLMNETTFPVCLDSELSFKYCRKFCDLCTDVTGVTES